MEATHLVPGGIQLQSGPTTYQQSSFDNMSENSFTLFLILFLLNLIHYSFLIKRISVFHVTYFYCQKYITIFGTHACPTAQNLYSYRREGLKKGRNRALINKGNYWLHW